MERWKIWFVKDNVKFAIEFEGKYFDVFETAKQLAAILNAKEYSEEQIGNTKDKL